MQTTLRVWLLLAMLVEVRFLTAQNTVAESITIADGLSQGMIYDILQDRDGFLWVATKDGLNRFDGYRFEVFTNDPFDPYSIAGNDIHRLFEDSRGNLWISVGGKGLDVWVKKTGKFHHLPYNAVKDDVTGPPLVVESPDGNYWLLTVKNVIRLRWKKPGEFDARKPDLLASMTMEEIENTPIEPGDYFNEIFANPDGTLVLESNKRKVYHYLPTENRFNFVQQFKIDFWGSMIFETAPGRHWVVEHNRNFVVLENGVSKRLVYTADFIPEKTWFQHLQPDGKGNLVLVWRSAVSGHTLFYTVPENDLLSGNYLGPPKLMLDFEENITLSIIDRTGNLWMGTGGFGLRKLNLSRQPFRLMVPNKGIEHIVTDGQDIFIRWDNMLSGKLNVTTGKLDSILSKEAILNNFIKAADGTTYFTLIKSHGTTTDFGVKRAGIEQLLNLQGSFMSKTLMEDSFGRIWAGFSATKLACYFKGNFYFLDLTSGLGNWVTATCFYEDNEQNLWVGTHNGLVRIPLKDLKFGQGANGQATITSPSVKIYQNDADTPHSLRHNHVTSICPDPLAPNRYIWLGTKGGGLQLFDKTTEKFTHFTAEKSDLPNDVVYGVLPGIPPSGKRGELWLSTNRGLSRLTVSAGQAPDQRTYRFLNFRASDGLQDDEFNTNAFAKMNDGTLLFGGIKGITAFDPAAIIERKLDAPVLLTELKINNLAVSPLKWQHENGEDNPLQQPLHLTKELELRHTENNLTLEFSLMDFGNTKENRYRYRLVGAHPDWVEAGTNHVANYSRLRPGSYTFEVQGSIGGEEWSAPATLTITVLPPWWATWWAYGVYALLLAAGAWSLYQFKLRQNRENAEKKRLQALDEFKSRFFTNITHEFRTPLTVILGMAEQVDLEIEKLEIGKLKPEHGGKTISNFQFLISKIGLIRRNGQNLLHLINQILDLSKLESNSLKINYIQGDVLPYLRYISESLHSFANAQNVMVRVESTEPEIVMDYDPERLLQIVHNLLSNAIKFTPSGGRVTLRAGLLNLEGLVNLDLKVIDTGVGIPPEDLPNIFDRFFQADNHRHTKANGTGIGLSLTKELVRAMGGDIRVESEMGRGTTFTVQLPIVQSPPEKSGQALTPKGEPHPGSSISNSAEFDGLGSPLGLRLLAKQIDGQEGLSHEGSPSILLIEDNPDVVEYLAACLSSPLAGGREGAYQLDFAYNGRAGIEKALETVPDLIISDVMMPEKDGFEVCDTLKNDERTSHIPIILLTAKADIESRIAGLKRGADAYLAKPFHQEELLVTVGNLLELRRKLQARYGKLEIGKRPALPEDREIDVVPGDSSLMPHSSSLEEVFLQKLNAQIAERLADVQFDGPQLARAMGLSEVQLYRKIKALTDKSTAIYIRSVRLSKGRELLLNTNKNVSEVAYEVGFDNPSYFSRTFSQEFGIAPSDLRK